MPYYPLAQGLLTGKFRRGEAPTGRDAARRPGSLDDAAFDKVAPLEAYAKERGLSLLQVAIGGLAAQPGVSSVIAGATKPRSRFRPTWPPPSGCLRVRISPR